MLMLLYTTYCCLLLPFSTQLSSSVAGMCFPGLQQKCRVRIAAAAQALVRAVSVLPGELATLPWFGGQSWSSVLTLLWQLFQEHLAYRLFTTSPCKVEPCQSSADVSKL
jgi:hypothetical protein